MFDQENCEIEFELCEQLRRERLKHLAKCFLRGAG